MSSAPATDDEKAPITWVRRNTKHPLKKGEAAWWNDDLHGELFRVSHSALEIFMDSIPRYVGFYITKTIERKPESEARILGKGLHLFLGEDEAEIERVLRIAPDLPKRKDVDKATWAEFYESCADDSVVLTIEQLDCVKHMVESAIAHDPLGDYIARPGWYEQAAIYRDAATGVYLKLVFDKLCEDGTILDLKTAWSIHHDNFSRSTGNYGYHRQADIYIRARNALGFNPEADYLLGAIQSDEPFEVATYRLGKHSMMVAETQNNNVLGEYAICASSGDWSSRYAGSIHELELQPWQMKLDE